MVPPSSPPYSLPFIFHPPMVPPARGDSGGTKVVPPNPPRDGLSSTEMESRALRSLGVHCLLSCRRLLVQSEERARRRWSRACCDRWRLAPESLDRSSRKVPRSLGTIWRSLPSFFRL